MREQWWTSNQGYRDLKGTEYTLGPGCIHLFSSLSKRRGAQCGKKKRKGEKDVRERGTGGGLEIEAPTISDLHRSDSGGLED